MPWRAWQSSNDPATMLGCSNSKSSSTQFWHTDATQHEISNCTDRRRCGRDHRELRVDASISQASHALLVRHGIDGVGAGGN
jgi:hypothetical protein